MSFFKPLAVFLQNLHNSSVSWKITPLYFCSSNNIYFGHKEPIKTKKLFRLFECLGQNLRSWCQSWIQFLLNFYFTLHCHSTQLHWNLKLIHFLLWTKRSYESSNFDTCKCSGENLQNSSCHFPSATSQLFFKFCITLQCQERLFLCTFQLKQYILCSKGPH